MNFSFGVLTQWKFDLNLRVGLSIAHVIAMETVAAAQKRYSPYFGVFLDFSNDTRTSAFKLRYQVMLRINARENVTEGIADRADAIHLTRFSALYLIYGSILVLNSPPEKTSCHFPDEANPMCPDTTA
jgi:hypothetical protein